MKDPEGLVTTGDTIMAGIRAAALYLVRSGKAARRGLLREGRSQAKPDSEK